MSHFFSYNGVNWEYEVFGKGTEPLLAFHGFGNTADAFKTLEPALGNKFRIISFNLPHHGKTTAENHSHIYYSKKALHVLFEKFLSQFAIKRFSLMGFSLGGKIALQLIEFFPGRINTVLLFAPDGMGNSWQKSIVIKTYAGRKIYQRIIHNPAPLIKLIDILRRIKLLSPKLSEFVQYHLSTLEKRRLVWDVWMCFRDINPNLAKIQNILNNKSNSRMRLHLFFGKYDSIIPPSLGEKFVNRLKNKEVLHIVEAGHYLLKPSMNKELEKVL